MVKNVLEYLEQTEQKYSRKTAVEDGCTSLTYLDFNHRISG